MTDRRRRRSDMRPERVLVPPAPFPSEADPAGARSAVAEALDAARRWRRPLAVAVIEVDPPDPGGRDAPLLAPLTLASLREGDAVWLEGPERLLVLLGDADLAGVGPPVERVRGRLERAGFSAVRVGLAVAAPGIDADELIALARSGAGVA
jgi:hypothetical protein